MTREVHQRFPLLAAGMTLALDERSLNNYTF
jgi:hypothetical protein